MLEQQSVPNTFIKSSVYYYVRRVPKHLRQHYDRKRICFSLRTKNAKVASKRAEQASFKLDEVWFQLSIGNKFEHQGLLTGLSVERNDGQINQSTPLLSEALDYYLAQKAEGKSKNFTQCNKRACEIVAIQSEKDIGIEPLTNSEITVLLAIVECIDYYGVNPSLSQLKTSSQYKNIATATFHKSLRNLIIKDLVNKHSKENPPVYSL